MKAYRDKKWREFRDTVIELDGSKCAHCRRTKEEVVLQVHHKRYIPGRLPWEYGTSDCITLCKGCHAREHGLIKPNTGWEYMGYEDLGNRDGECENCENHIRYVFYVFHENWGTIEVGTICCDHLTDTTEASTKAESIKRYESRKKRFLKSSRWKKNHGTHRIKLKFEVIIRASNDGCYYLTIHGYESKKPYSSLVQAKEKAFDTIESGAMQKFLLNHKH